jgi:hypothetical protein
MAGVVVQLDIWRLHRENHSLIADPSKLVEDPARPGA